MVAKATSEEMSPKEAMIFSRLSFSGRGWRYRRFFG